MAIKIISDVHGEYAALAEQLDAGDTAILLGDYVNLIDFQTLDGILAEVYTREEVVRALTILASGTREDRDEARRQIRELMAEDMEKTARLGQLVFESYREFFASIPCRAFLIYGNTDNPHLIRQLASENVEMIETGTVEIDGQVFGFVSGSPRGPWTVGLPGEMDSDEYERRVRSLDPVDVLCTHYPPAVPELTWDLLANRDEAGSEAVLDYLKKCSPSHHYFGHVHHPRESTGTIGSTCLVNAGFFREHRTALVHPAECPD